MEMIQKRATDIKTKQDCKKRTGDEALSLSLQGGKRAKISRGGTILAVQRPSIPMGDCSTPTIDFAAQATVFMAQLKSLQSLTPQHSSSSTQQNPEYFYTPHLAAPASGTKVCSRCCIVSGQGAINCYNCNKSF
jgi:hypothetical protein